MTPVGMPSPAEQSGDILDTIDGTLRDFEVGVDAMRWNPEPAARTLRCSGPGRLFWNGRYIGDTADLVFSFGTTAVAREVREQAEAEYERMVAPRPTVASFTFQVISDVMHNFHVALALFSPRCHYCNPRANPPRSRYGAAYRQRQKARRRRRR